MGLIPAAISILSAKEFEEVGWKIMEVITAATFIGLVWRLFPRRTR